MGHDSFWLRHCLASSLLDVADVLGELPDMGLLSCDRQTEVRLRQRDELSGAAHRHFMRVTWIAACWPSLSDNIAVVSAACWVHYPEYSFIWMAEEAPACRRHRRAALPRSKPIVLAAV